MVLLNMTFNDNGLARKGGSQCPLRSPDEIANGTCMVSLWRRGDVTSRGRASTPPAACRVATPCKKMQHASPSSDAMSDAPTPPSCSSMLASPTDEREHEQHAQTDWNLLLIPASAAAVPAEACNDNGNHHMYVSAQHGGHEGMAGPGAHETLESDQSGGVGSSSDSTMLWPSRQAHQGYPDPAQEIRFTQHVDQQFLRFYPCSLSGGGGRRTENPDGRDYRAPMSDYNEDSGALEWGVMSQWDQDGSSMDVFAEHAGDHDMAGMEMHGGDCVGGLGGESGGGYWVDGNEWDGRPGY